MARRHSGSSGCLLGLTLLVAPCFVGFPALVLASPVLTPYFWWSERAQFAEKGTSWVVMAAAAPFLAAVLVRWAGRLPLVPTLQRAGVLLAATSGSALAALLLGTDAHSPTAARETFTVVGAAALAAVLVLGYLRFRARGAAAAGSHGVPRERDRRPVTVEAVRQAAAEGDRTLRRVRAENQRLTRMVREVEQKLAAPTADFSVLCQLHFESRGCADAAHSHYRSARVSCATMASLVRRTGSASTRMRVGRTRAGELASAGAALATTRDRLGTEVARGLGLVQTLNAYTAQLKYRIRDDCGTRGSTWYTALEERIAAARG